MKMQDVSVGVTMDIVRINYECAEGCGAAYTEQQFNREINPECGRCGGALEKLTLVIGRREPTSG